MNELSEEKADEIFSNLNDNDLQEDLHELLEYKANTAGGLMSTRALVVKENQTKYDIFILNEKNILLGTCSLKNLLIQSDNIPIKDYMEVKEKVISFSPHEYNRPWINNCKY